MEFFRNPAVPIVITPTVKEKIDNEMILRILVNIFDRAILCDTIKDIDELSYIQVVNIKIKEFQAEVNILQDGMLTDLRFESLTKLPDMDTTICVVETWNGRDETVDDHYITICYPEEI